MTTEKRSSGGDVTASGEVVIEARTIQEAVRAAAGRLNCPTKHVRHLVLEQPSAGFFGFWSRPARIRAWKQDPVERQVDDALRVVRDLDGHFLIECVEQDLLLTVFPPMGAGRAPEVSKVRTAIEEYEPAEADWKLIEETVSSADGKAHKVGLLARSGEKDGFFHLHVDGDKLFAEIALSPPKKGGRPVTIEDVARGLVRQGIVHGVDAHAIEVAIEKHKYGVPIRVATGDPAEDGSPGRLEMKFRGNRHVLSLKEDEHGRVDHRSLDLVETVKSGDVLALRHPPRPGRPGKNIYGEEIPAVSGVAADMPEGENILHDGDIVRSGIDGHVSLVGKRIVVMPVYHVKGDVNYSTGNIDFDGTVCIDGLIEDAFSVRAGGSLFVKKSIGKCKVDVGGNLAVLGGILGRHEAVVTVNGDLAALFVEHARLSVGGDLVVSQLILHSETMVGGDLVMDGKRAALVGGVHEAGGNITVRAIGGEGTTRTHVRAGVPVDIMLRERKIRDEVAGIEEMMARLADVLKAVKDSSGDLNGKIEQVRSKHDALLARQKGLKEEMRSIENEIDHASIRAAVHVIDTAMAGTKIEIGNTSLVLASSVKYATFKRHAGRINMYPYSGELATR